MTDAMLAQFVEYVETGRWSDVRIAVSIPGGIFAGELISARQFMEEWEGQTLSQRLGEPTNDFEESLSPAPSLETSQTASPDYLHMRKAALLSAPLPRGKPFHLGQLRVRLEQVSAWSIERSEGE